MLQQINWQGGQLACLSYTFSGPSPRRLAVNLWVTKFQIGACSLARYFSERSVHMPFRCDSPSFHSYIFTVKFYKCYVYNVL